GFALGVDGKDYAPYPALAVVVRCLLHRRQHALGAGGIAEILRHARLKLVVPVIAMAAAWLLRMGVNVDRDQFIELHADPHPFMPSGSGHAPNRSSCK